MDIHNNGTSSFNYINGLVEAFLDNIDDRPVPHGAEGRLAEIREAVAKGIATVDMGLNIIELFPSGPSRSRDRRAAA